MRMCSMAICVGHSSQPAIVLIISQRKLGSKTRSKSSSDGKKEEEGRRNGICARIKKKKRLEEPERHFD
jgi:hypothetical protein